MPCYDRGSSVGVPVENRHREDGLPRNVIVSALFQTSGLWYCTETNVAGRKSIVKSAMLFIAELSLLLAAAMLFESLATSTFNSFPRWLV